jgi:hypothetical protein
MAGDYTVGNMVAEFLSAYGVSTAFGMDRYDGFGEMVSRALAVKGLTPGKSI